MGTWQGHLGLYSIVLLIHRIIALSAACQQVKSNSLLTSLRLAEIFKLGPYDIQAKIFRWQAPWHILIHTRISTPCYHFLAFLGIWQYGKLTIWYALKLQLPLEKSMVQVIIHSPVHHWPFNIWNKHRLHKRLWLSCRWFNKLWALDLCFYIRLEDSCETIELSWQTLVLTTWAELFVNLGILGPWIFVLRPLLSRYNSYKDSTYFTSRMEAKNTVTSEFVLYNSK